MRSEKENKRDELLELLINVLRMDFAIVKTSFSQLLIAVRYLLPSLAAKWQQWLAVTSVGSLRSEVKAGYFQPK